MDTSIAQTAEHRVFRTQRHDRAPGIGKACGHVAHVGTCGSCQRTQLARWRTQLAEASRRVR